MTKALHGAKFDNFWQQMLHLPVAAQLMMAAVLHQHNIVIKSHISHNCFIIIVFLYSQKFFWATITQFHIITVWSFIFMTWPIKIHQYGRDGVWIMTSVLLGPCLTSQRQSRQGCLHNHYHNPQQTKI